MSSEIILKPKTNIDIPVVSVGQYIWENVAKYGNKVCIIESNSGKQLDFKTLLLKSKIIANSLLNENICKSDIFLLFSANCIEYVLLQFAIYLLGNTFTPVKPTNGVFELRNQLKDSGASVIITSVKNAVIVDKILNKTNDELIKKQIKIVVVLDGSYKDFVSMDALIDKQRDDRIDKIPYFNINPKKDIFIIGYTSGTTGVPKGAMVSHYSFVAVLEDVNCQKPNPMTSANIYPFGHMSGSATLAVSLICGNAMVLYEDITAIDILKSIEKYRINSVPMFPYFAKLLLDDNLTKGYDLSSVMFMNGSGVKFPPELIRQLFIKFKVPFFEFYGLSEYMTPVSGGTNGSVGSVHNNTELKIIDLISGQSLGPNITGEICLRGIKMFSGYLNNEVQTKAVIDRKGWLHTGDIGYYDDNEKMYITDRIKELIKYKHWSVAPAEVEALLMTHESVAETVVVGVRHETDGQHPRAYVKAKTDRHISGQELIDFVEGKSALQNRLRAGVVFVDEIPRTVLGKVDRVYFNNLIKDQILY